MCVGCMWGCTCIQKFKVEVQNRLSLSLYFIQWGRFSQSSPDLVNTLVSLVSLLWGSRLGPEAGIINSPHASLPLQTDFSHMLSICFFVFFLLHCIYFVQGTNVEVRGQVGPHSPECKTWGLTWGLNSGLRGLTAETLTTEQSSPWLL